MKIKSTWGQQLELKNEYTNENEGKVKKYKMNKEELEIYLKELEKKNRYKNGDKLNG